VVTGDNTECVRSNEGGRATEKTEDAPREKNGAKRNGFLVMSESASSIPLKVKHWYQ
jgi:hypothetical protein